MKHRKVTAKKRILIGIIIALCVCIAGMIAGFTIYRSVHGRGSVSGTEDQTVHKKEDSAPKKSDAGKEEQAEPSDPVRDRAEEILKGMSLQEKVDQMFLITPEKLTGVSVVVQAGESTKAALKEHPVGGLVYFSQNLESAEQTASMIQSVQEYSRIPLLPEDDPFRTDVPLSGARRRSGAAKCTDDRAGYQPVRIQYRFCPRG